jgi:hypothetical protein
MATKEELKKFSVPVPKQSNVHKFIIEARIRLNWFFHRPPKTLH